LVGFLGANWEHMITSIVIEIAAEIAYE